MLQGKGSLTPTDKDKDKDKGNGSEMDTIKAAAGRDHGGGDGDSGNGVANNGVGNDVGHVANGNHKHDRHNKDDQDDEEEDGYFDQEDPSITAQRGVVYLDGLGDIVDIQAPLPKVELNGDITATVSQLAHYSIVVTTFERCAAEWRIANQVHTPTYTHTHIHTHTYTHTHTHTHTHIHTHKHPSTTCHLLKNSTHCAHLDCTIDCHLYFHRLTHV